MFRASRGAALLLLLAAACRPVGIARRPPVEEVLLERQEQGLRALLAAAKSGRLIPYEQALVVVSDSLVQSLIEATLPLEQLLENRYRVRVESARVAFEDNFAQVQLRGRASLVDDPETAAEIDVYGAIDVIDLDPQTGILRGRVTVLAVETQRVDVAGVPAPVRRLVDDLSREQLKTFEPLLQSIEIPVRLEQNVRVPPLDQGGIRIAEAVLPLEAAVTDVKAFRGKLWICATAKAEMERGAK